MKRILIALYVLVCASVSIPVFAAETPGEYRLGAGDTIRIVVFQNPDLTLETRVSESGAINYPMIGAVQLGGLTVGSAEQHIAKGLRDGDFVQHPQVNITLLQVRGNQVSVLGQVARPGRVPLETFTTRVSEVLAMVGGVSPTGADTAILVGTRDGKPFRKEIDVAGLYLSDQSPEDIVVASGDTIYVHRAPVYYVYGEVQHPGSFRVERGLTVRQALAQGGGLTARGTESRLRLHRKGSDGRTEEIRPSLDTIVLPDDVLFVRESLF
jgi:polysaccharide export outer membrane protein